MPLSLLYGAAVMARFALTRPERSRLPVICIGNFTMGGAGKTPLAIAIARMLREEGLEPAFLTRGYGGSEPGPLLVDPAIHDAARTGDEPLLLARHAPTVVSRRRPLGARLIETLGAHVIIMDDGFQNPSLRKDLSVIAVDGAAGLGNGQVFPAGPLRAPYRFQAARAGAIVVSGGPDDPRRLFPDLAGPVFRCTVRPAQDTGWLGNRRVLAFSGIGRPEKFFETLRQAKAILTAAVPFPDHHMYTEAEAAKLLADAQAAGAMLVTTEKDWIRIPPDGPPALAALRENARPLAIKAVFDGGDAALKALILTAIKR